MFRTAMRPTHPCHQPPARLALAAALACGAISSAHAALVEISNVPLSASLSQVKPNIMFILDDSGSMGFAYMPDEVGIADWTGKEFENYGAYSSHCNGLAFDPTKAYAPPVYANGTSYPNVSFTAAPANGDGFNPDGKEVSLAGRFYYVHQNPKNLPALDWTYTASGVVDKSTPFYQDCTLSISPSNDAKKLFERFELKNSTADIQQKYANWYAYYRTRRLLMRTAAGKAFSSVKDNFRVGFTVISDSEINDSSKFLNVDDFTTDQRKHFYDLLYTKQTLEGFTPLRGALSKTGRYFAKKIPGQVHDPITHSCQRNYALLSTDGYWNTGQYPYPGEETATYGPLQLDGSAIGQQDGAEKPPMKDGKGVSNSLADVAQYFWATDLRPNDADKGTDNVRPTAGDPAKHQHLNTFTVGLGVRGTLSYKNDYLTKPTGDFADILAGRKDWPVPLGTVSPTPNAADATHIDDLWHAAVNGRGQYFSASDPTTLSKALSDTLNAISEDVGSSAAASASSLTPVTGDNWVFLPSYSNSPTWHGDLRAFQFTTDAKNGLTPPDTRNAKAVWSAKDKLDKRDPKTRDVRFGGSAGKLVDFTYANLQKQYGADLNPCEGDNPLSQCSGLAQDVRTKATGENLVNFLRGDKTLQTGAGDAGNRVFRDRISPLGDFVNATPVYVAKPPFKYADAGYAQFVTKHVDRKKMVYAPSNDGMLHAFQVGQKESDELGGEELWAFVPSGVMPHLRRLADVNYDANHMNLLDATPTVGDIFDGEKWRTILVGGMGAGGRYYYALDITNPNSPELLWEFNDSQANNLGWTFGNPVITKDVTGAWIVAFTSGINNVTGKAPGQGRLYLLNALTGERRASGLQEIITPAGTAETPNNLGRLNAWVQSDTDNTALRFYAGDMLGNLWRFDHDHRVAPSGVEAVLIGQARGPTGLPQPITGKPVLTELFTNNTPITVVSFGTGLLLSNTDLSSKETQTVYSVRDALDSTSLGSLRDTPAKLVRQTLNSKRLLDDPPQSVDWTTQNGWFVDLNVKPDGERITLDGVPLGSDLIAFASTAPNSDPCGSGGSSYLYQFMLSSGRVKQVATSDSLIVGVSRVMDSNGLVSAFFTKRDQSTELKAAGVEGGPNPPVLRRAAWRELN